MKNSSEQPKNYSGEEMAELEKSRTISDAELLNSGAKYKVNKKGDKTLNLDDWQIEKIKRTEDKETIRDNVLEMFKKYNDTFGILKNEKFVPKRFLKEFLGDREIALAAVAGKTAGGSTPQVFTLFSKELQADRKFVFEAVKHNHEIFDYLSPKFKNDPKIREIVGDIYVFKDK